MARLTYAFLAAAAAALISGFFIKGSSFPLLISIALSVAVAALIMYGWSRRARDGLEGADEEELIEEFEIVDDGEEVAAVTAPKKSSRRQAKADETIEIETDESLFAPPATAKAKSKAKAKSASTAKSPAPAKKSAPAKATTARTVEVAVVPGASRFHRPTCRFANPDKVRIVPKTVARKRGYLPCDVCKP